MDKVRSRKVDLLISALLIAVIGLLLIKHEDNSRTIFSGTLKGSNDMSIPFALLREGNADHSLLLRIKNTTSETIAIGNNDPQILLEATAKLYRRQLLNSPAGYADKYRRKDWTECSFLRPDQSLEIELPIYRFGPLKNQQKIEVRLKLTTNFVDMTGFVPIDHVIKFSEFESETFLLDL